MAARLSKINLLPKDSFEFSGLGRFLTWSLSSGRAMVVLTEFVVILAFASRFYFDKRVNDLAEVMDQKQVLIMSYEEIEKQARAILAKQKIVEKYLSNNLQFQKKIELIRSFTPLEVSYNSIGINGDQITLDGVSGSELGLMSIVSGLSKLNNLDQISIGGIDYDQKSSLLSFKISAKLKQGI